MISARIQKLIEAHQSDTELLKYVNSLKHVGASRVAAIAGSTYELVRNAIDFEQDHLLRRRAIKRILIRKEAIKRTDALDIALDLAKELIWAKYTKQVPIPEITVEQIAIIIQKYQKFNSRYFQFKKVKLSHDDAIDLYNILSFEIERLIMPYKSKDALINLAYFYLSKLNIIKDSHINESEKPIQTYIGIMRTLTKYDNAMISYHLFVNAFAQWTDAKTDFTSNEIDRITKLLANIRSQVNIKLKNRTTKEITRQITPFKILNQIISSNPTDAIHLLKDKAMRDAALIEECNREYNLINDKIRKTIVRMVIYLALTKMIFALIIEVPYELTVHGKLNYLQLGINILFPPILMAIISSSFRIPKNENTNMIIQMVDQIINTSNSGANVQSVLKQKPKPLLFMIFQIIYYAIFFAFLGLLTFMLREFLNFDMVGIGVFILFISLVSFGALRVRNIATELIVVPQRVGLFTPLLDIIATPILYLGKRLSEGVSKFSPLPFIFDYIIESPFKGIIKLVEEWNSYIKEQRDEIA